MDRAWPVAIAPYAALAALLALVVPAGQGAGHAALLLALMVAHATCYARWHPASPRRILVNEALTRLWFATYTVLVAGHGGGRLEVALLTYPVALASAALQVPLTRRGYRVAGNVLHLGLYLAALAAILALATR